MNVNDGLRTTEWRDGNSGSVMVKIGTRLPGTGTLDDNYLSVNCRSTINGNSLITAPVSYKAPADDYEFINIDPVERQIRYYGPAGETDFLYDGTIRQTFWLNDSNLQVVTINTRNIAVPGTYDKFSCLAETIELGSTIGTVATMTLLANDITIGSIAPIEAGNPPVPVIPNVPITNSIIMDAVTMEIGTECSLLTIGDTATEVILGNDTDTFSIGDTCAFLEVGNDSTTLNIGAGTVVATAITIGANNAGQITIIDGDETNILGTVVNIEGTTDANIGVRNSGAIINSVNIGTGTQRTDTTIGQNNTGQITNLLGETTNINASTTNIGERNTSAGLPNVVNIGAGTNATTVNIGAIADITQTTNIVQSVNLGVRNTVGTHNEVNIGTGTSATDIVIGSVVDQANQLTIFHGTVEFTGTINVNAGGNAMNIFDFINQLP